MRKNAFAVWFIVAVLFGVVAAGAVVTVLRSAARMERVVVAAREMGPYQAVTASDVRVEEVPASAVPADAVREIASCVGKFTRGLVLPGEVLRQGHLVRDAGTRGALGAKLTAMGDGRLRAFAVPYSLETGVGGELREGDRVDLLATVTVGVKGGQVVLSKVLAAGVEVLRVVGSSNDPTKPSQGSAVVLAVTPELAEDLAYALQAGTLRMLLNPYRADESAAETQGVVAETFLQKYGYTLVPAQSSQGPPGR
ncbi:MAG: Flp pilus assembly protein CpaB [Bacillota bacterium]